MAYETIILEKKDSIATVTLNRPDRLNAINPRMFEEIREVYAVLDRDRDIKVVVLTGTGRAFCAGGDVKQDLMADIERRQKGEEGEDITPRFDELDWSSFIDIKKPTIAMVNGLAVGAGCGMTLVSDIVIASEAARFTIPFTRRGTSPAFAITYFLPRVVGYHKALEICLTAKMMEAREAKEIGLVNEVVPASELARVTYDMSNAIAKLPDLAIRSTKRLIYQGMANDLNAQLQLELYSRNYLHGTHDFEESTRAFIEKREPKFEGR